MLFCGQLVPFDECNLVAVRFDQGWKGDCFLSAKLEEMRLKYIAEECLELFDHRLPEEKQCSGWFRLKRLVIEGKEQLTDDDLKLFHPILRDAIKNNWSNIRQCTVD